MSKFYLDNKTFELVVDEFEKSANVLQTNIAAFTPEQIDFAKAQDFYNEIDSTINFADIADIDLKGKEWMTINGAIPEEFSEILNNSSSKSIFRQALGTEAPNEGKSNDGDFLATSAENTNNTESNANNTSKPKYFFAYYPIAEVGGYDYLQVVCKEFKADKTLSSISGAYSETKKTQDKYATNKDPIYNSDTKQFNALQVQRATSRYMKGGVTKGIVQLPMTGGLSETNSVDWGKSSINALQTFGARQAGTAIRAAGGGKPVAGIQQMLGGLGQGAQEVVQGVSNDDLVAYFAGQAVGLGGDLLTRSSGVALNNNLELLFKGPQLRSFSYTYQFTPRGEKESQMVKDIIWFFKKQMRPKLQKKGIFLQSPNVFKLKYMFKRDGNAAAEEHPFMNKIKMCALTGCNVTYGGAQYMTYDDGSLTQYGMQLSFNELDPIYYDDYGETPAHGHYDDTKWEVAI